MWEDLLSVTVRFTLQLQSSRQCGPGAVAWGQSLRSTEPNREQRNRPTRVCGDNL